MKEVPQTPWMSHKHIEDILKHAHGSLGFEYGCGGSTILFSQSFDKYISVEHHKVWYDKIGSQVPKNVILKLREPIGNIFPPPGPGNPIFQRDYINTINETSDIYDFILVDGRCRVECAKASMKNMNAHSVLFVHDYERPRYHALEKFLKLQAITAYDDDHRALARFSL